ncbi:hypothetical protein EDB83DRAFT_2325626 [Lactarius deliciosus]|nr:hypothetical protein EDB83DRAFT_2325626 [Lactarius deliciosus]
MYEAIVTRADSVETEEGRGKRKLKAREGGSGKSEVMRTKDSGNDRARLKRLTRQEVETLEFFAKVAITIVKKVRPREEQQRVSSKDRECEKRVNFEVGEERNEDGKSGALMLRPDLEEMSKSHRERRDQARVGGKSTMTFNVQHDNLYTSGRRGVEGQKHKANARQRTRVASKVGCSVGKGAWPNDDAGDLDDAHCARDRERELI